MPLIVCSICGSKLKSPAYYDGRAAKCPICQGLVALPPKEVVKPLIEQEEDGSVAANWPWLVLGGVSLVVIAMVVVAGFHSHYAKAEAARQLAAAETSERERAKAMLEEEKRKIESERAALEEQRLQVEMEAERQRWFAENEQRKRMEETVREEGEERRRQTQEAEQARLARELERQRLNRAKEAEEAAKELRRQISVAIKKEREDKSKAASRAITEDCLTVEGDTEKYAVLNGSRLLRNLRLAYSKNELTLELIGNLRTEFPVSAWKAAKYLVDIGGDWIPQGGDDTVTIRDAWNAAVELVGK